MPQERLRLCLPISKLNPRTPADIFICSYPKSGTTWTQALVHALITLGKSPLSEEEGDWHITEFCPFYEADRTWSSGEDDGNEPFAPLYARRQRETGRRAYNTHLRWDMMPTEGNTGARFLYLVRDGRDVAVSYYHHMRSMVRLCVCMYGLTFSALNQSFHHRQSEKTDMVERTFGRCMHF